MCSGNFGLTSVSAMTFVHKFSLLCRRQQGEPTGRQRPPNSFISITLPFVFDKCRESSAIKITGYNECPRISSRPPAMTATRPLSFGARRLPITIRPKWCSVFCTGVANGSIFSANGFQCSEMAFSVDDGTFAAVERM